MKTIEYHLVETFGLKGTLKEGVVEFLQYGKLTQLRSLYVPGIGWCPILKRLSENFTNDVNKLALFCLKDDEKSTRIATWISLATSTTIPFRLTGGNHACDRLDIFCYKNDSSNKITIRYNSIRGEEGCNHLPIVLGYINGNRISFEYFIDISGIQVFVSHGIAKYIENNGFDGLRVDYRCCNGYPCLVHTKKEQADDYNAYDNLLIMLNDYHIKPLQFMGIEPFYFLEDYTWKNRNKYILPNNTSSVNVMNQEDAVNQHMEKQVKIKVYEPSIEDELKTLVEFFMPMGFTSSSEVSNYIRMHHLGKDYPNISGFLELEQDGNVWEFEGGIAPQYYAEVCRRLGLDNNHSGAIVTDFESYHSRE